MAYYVFRVNDGEWFDTIRKEILQGRLRQGWGAKGMDVRLGCDEYIKTWNTKWGRDDADKERQIRKYNNIKKMENIKIGDIIIIPKLSLELEYPSRCFAIVKCISEYEFSLMDGIDDFGHIIGVEPLFSCPYEYDANSIHIKSKFRAYQSAINQVYNDTFTEAVDGLIAGNDCDPIKADGETKDLLFIMAQSVTERYDVFVEHVLSELRKFDPKNFENIIVKLFEKNGYVLERMNDYDRQGGDIDITMILDNKSLLGSIFRQAKGIEQPEINIQAKKKSGIDHDDKKAVEQLIQRRISKGRSGSNDINIVIDLTDEFTESTEKFASENNIILINGKQFASLLIQFGISGEMLD